jgi:hypothetical protein
MPDEYDEHPTDEDLAESAKRVGITPHRSATMRDRFDDHPTDEELAYDAARVLGPRPSSATMPDEHPPSEEELARNERKLFGEKDLFGSNVVPLRSAQPDESGSVEDIVVNKLNKYYAKTMLGNKFKIIDESVPGVVRFLDEKDFIAILRSEKALITITEPNGTIKPRIEPVTTIWLNHRKARIYRMVIFDTHKIFDPTVWGPHVDYNLWRGPATFPQKGSCYKTLRYIRDVVCNGDKETYRWLMAWVAHMVFRPWEKPDTAIAIQGEEEGTGKSFFVWILSLLLDGKEESMERSFPLYFKASSAKMITGEFNGHLEHCLLLHAEEAFRAESDREDAIIKDLISGGKLGIHGKYRDAKLSNNYIRLILTGNPPHIVKVGRFARRFLVLKISDKKMLKTDYFGDLAKNLHCGALEALMYYLKKYPIHKFNLRVAPKTAALADQKEASSTPEEQFWKSRLYTGELTMDGTVEKGQNKYYANDIGTEYLIIKNRLYRNYEKFAKNIRGARVSDEVWFGRRFAKFFNAKESLVRLKVNNTGAPLIGLATDKLPDNTNYYVIPKLSICRELFSDYIGQPIEWPDDVEDWLDKPFG